MNLPNKLTVLRVLMVPFFVLFMLTDLGGVANKWIALAIFVVASLTDLLDGKIARKYNLVTNFGKFMDPLADKLLVCSAMICLIEKGSLAAWIVIVIIAREFIISGFRLVASDNGIVIVVAVLLVLFLGTRLGLSIRATGDNADMVRASSINPTFTITVGLCVANALTGLSGAMVAQYSTFADVNSGTGMVVLALAALVIGETLIGKSSMARGVVGVIAGSIIYRCIYAAALRFNVPADYMKLVSAIIVGAAIAAPAVRRWTAFQIQKRRAIAARKEEQ